MANPMDRALVAEVSEELADKVVNQFLKELYELQFIDDRNLSADDVSDNLVIKISDALDEIARSVASPSRRGSVQRRRRLAAPRGEREGLVQQLLDAFPKLREAVEASQYPDDYTGLDSLLNSRDPKRYADQIAVYTELASNGPDVPFASTAKIAARARRSLGTLLAAWEDGSLYTWLETNGYFGPASDEMRGPADRYW